MKNFSILLAIALTLPAGGARATDLTRKATCLAAGGSVLGALAAQYGARVAANKLKFSENRFNDFIAQADRIGNDLKISSKEIFAAAASIKELKAKISSLEDPKIEIGGYGTNQSGKSGQVRVNGGEWQVDPAATARQREYERKIGALRSELEEKQRIVRLGGQETRSLNVDLAAESNRAAGESRRAVKVNSALENVAKRATTALIGGSAAFGLACLISVAEAKKISADPIKSMRSSFLFGELARELGDENALRVIETIAAGTPTDTAAGLAAHLAEQKNTAPENKASVKVGRQ